MQIVIDIDEKDFNFIKSLKSIKAGNTFQQLATRLISSVKDGEIVYPMSVAPVEDGKLDHSKYPDKVCVDCDTCFNKRYYPSEVIQDVCRFCKEKNWRFYRSDLTDIKGQVVAVRRIKNDT